MPGGLIAFWVLLGLGGASAISDPQARLWSPVDPTTHSDLGQREAIEFYLTSNVPWTAVATPDVYGRERCLVTLTAWATLGRRMRLLLDGQEQTLDTSWSLDRELSPTGQTTVFEALFLDPVGGAVVAVRQTTVRCTRTQAAPTRNAALYDARGLRGYEPPCSCETAR